MIYFGVLGGIGAVAVAYILIVNAFSAPENVVKLDL